MYEPRHRPPLSRRHFLRRMGWHGAAAVGLLAGSLGLGMAGYAAFEGLGWRDAFLEAAMLLGGIGPVNAPRTDAGKLFAGGYALYAGLVFVVVAGLVLGPMFHRVLHKFHWDDGERREP